MTRDEIYSHLQKENPSTPIADLTIYADQFATYMEAQQNIEENGTIVSHPRTGQPMENPYVKIRASAQAAIQKLRRVKANQLWAAATK